MENRKGKANVLYFKMHKYTFFMFFEQFYFTFLKLYFTFLQLCVDKMYFYAYNTSDETPRTSRHLCMMWPSGGSFYFQEVVHD